MRIPVKKKSSSREGRVQAARDNDSTVGTPLLTTLMSAVNPYNTKQSFGKT